MIIKHEPKGEPNGVAKWDTSLSWFDAGRFVPATVEILYAYPSMEIIDIEVVCDRGAMESSGLRIESILSAMAMEEFAAQKDKLKRQHTENEKERRKHGRNTRNTKPEVPRIDPLFN